MTDKDKCLRSAKPDVKSYSDGFEIGDRLPWPMREAKRDFYKAYIFAALTMTSGDVGKASRLTEIQRTNIYRMLRKVGYSSKDFKPKKSE